MFDISQGYINYNSETTVECIQAELQEAGRYLVSEHVTAGYSKSDFKMKKTSASGENYDHTVLPAVESVTPNEGLAGGQTIMISGSGFSTTTSDVSVSVDGVACDIESSSLTEI